MNIKVKVHGVNNVSSILRKYPDRIGRSMESILKQEGRGLAVELARNTVPFGYSDRAKKRSEKAVASDIRRIYMTPSEAYDEIEKTDLAGASSFWMHVSKRRYAKSSKALGETQSKLNGLKVTRLDPSLHGWDKIVKEGQPPKQIVTTNKARANYIKRIQRRVGFGKGSWINAAKSLGGRVRGAAQWVSRHKAAKGSSALRKGKNPQVSVTSHVDYVDDILPVAGEKLALKVAAIRFSKAMQKSLSKMSRKTNRRMNRKR